MTIEAICVVCSRKICYKCGFCVLYTKNKKEIDREYLCSKDVGDLLSKRYGLLRLCFGPD